MKLEIEIGDSTRTIDIDEDAGYAGRFRLEIDGRTVEGDVLRPEPGTYTFYVGGRVVEARVSEGIGDTLSVHVGGDVTEVRVVNRKRRTHGGDAGAEGMQTLVAPMPGKVVAILAGPGTRVERGQGVIVVEAMKMQNEVKAPKEGIVAEVRVNVGDAVTAGQVLAVVE
jgi:acetyl/propionyl-CoA carboxylase alpha subunit